jgi:hypothetical protein
MIIHLYRATSRETLQRRSRPDASKSKSTRMVFKRLWKSVKERRGLCCSGRVFVATVSSVVMVTLDRCHGNA